MSEQRAVESRPVRVRARGTPVPAEGEDGLFTESWFPVCLSREVPIGRALGRTFLDGRIVVFRGDDGVAQVLSAWCPHMGANLGVGKVVGNRIQCAFHRWEFSGEGWCEKTGLGDPPPRNACLYKFHSRERWGLVWAFNGDDPWWDLPDYPRPDAELAFSTDYDVPALPVDPWVICANTPDWQHLKAVHRLEFDHEALYDQIEWTEHSMEYDLDAQLEQGAGPPLAARVGIYGTSFFRMHGEFMGQWFAALTAFHPVAPGRTQVYYSFGVPVSDGSDEDDARVAMAHDLLFRLGKSIITDDRPILHSLKYTPGVMTRSDRALARYLNMVRGFPRSHASADFIR
jgi:nitrite reductase/ring-hydroxylating ferredoxin subunit